MHSLGVNTVQKCPFRTGTVPLTDLRVWPYLLSSSRPTVQGRECVQVAGGCWFWLTWSFCQVDGHGKGCGQGERSGGLWLSWAFDGPGVGPVISRWLVCVCAVGRWSRSVTDELWPGSGAATVKLDQYWWKGSINSIATGGNLYSRDCLILRAMPLWIIRNVNNVAMQVLATYFKNNQTNKSLFLEMHWYLNSGSCLWAVSCYDR